MKKYIVTIKEIHSHKIEIEAESEEKALEYANNQLVLIENPDLNYETTLHFSQWDIEENNVI